MLRAHPVVGSMELSYEAMQIAADEGLTLVAYTTEPGTPAADALALLASRSASEAVDG